MVQPADHWHLDQLTQCRRLDLSRDRRVLAERRPKLNRFNADGVDDSHNYWRRLCISMMRAPALSGWKLPGTEMITPRAAALTTNDRGVVVVPVQHMAVFAGVVDLFAGREDAVRILGLRRLQGDRAGIH